MIFLRILVFFVPCILPWAQAVYLRSKPRGLSAPRGAERPVLHDSHPGLSDFASESVIKRMSLSNKVRK